MAVRPLVLLGDYYQLRLEPEKVEVTSEAVEEVVDALRRNAGTWEPVEERCLWPHRGGTDGFAWRIWRRLG